MLAKILVSSLALFNLAIFAMGQNSSGSLNQCGEVNNVNDSAGENWDYRFYCPDGYDCVNRVCRNQAGAVVKSLVDRCSTKSSQCDRNLNLTAKCGFSFTRSDGYSYYFNCDKSCDFPTSQCSDLGWFNRKVPAIITRCNYPNLLVMGGKCQNTCPSDLQCEQVVP